MVTTRQKVESYIGPDFDRIIAQRVFEHIPSDTIPYVLYLCSQIIEEGGKIGIVVPDFKKVIDTLNSLDPNHDTAIHFNKWMTWCHAEVFNEPNDPHQSLWTDKIARYYMELEGYWENIKIEDNFTIDNRDWYMKISAVKHLDL